MIENEYMKETSHEYCSTYKKYDTDSVYMGQSDIHGRPSGIVRMLYRSGRIFEGNVTADGLKNGFGVVYYNPETICLGWFKND